MANLVQTYVMHDSDPERRGATRINRRDAQSWNEKGFGVFQTVNYFRGPRVKANLLAINAWAVDIDTGTKSEQAKKIEQGLRPTMVVETKRGFQVYWKAKNASERHWKAIVWDRLVPFYGADKNAKDLCRILRVPGFNHLKDPANPFPVRQVAYRHVEYSEIEMIRFYPDQRAKERHKKALKQAPMEGSFWDRVWRLNCEYALSKLSGTSHVSGETYEFRQNSNGNRNILVNGKSTSCWIDQDGRIGSLDEGGPTIAQWLNWFHKDYKRVVEIIKQEFPECQEQATTQMALL